MAEKKSTDASKLDTNTVMGRISALIPEPVANQSSDDDSDADWNGDY
jgi:hypothetical protein